MRHTFFQALLLLSVQPQNALIKNCIFCFRADQLAAQEGLNCVKEDWRAWLRNSGGEDCPEESKVCHSSKWHAEKSCIPKARRAAIYGVERPSVALTPFWSIKHWNRSLRKSMLFWSMKLQHESSLVVLLDYLPKINLFFHAENSISLKQQREYIQIT